MKRRKVTLNARSIFPVLMIAEDDPATGALRFTPLPLEWALVWRWLAWYWLPGAVGNLWDWLAGRPSQLLEQGRAGWQALAGRLELEVRMSLILINAWLEVSRVAVS